jgi:serine/threonine protein kinase
LALQTSVSPAESLLGIALGDWMVVERFERDPRATGGNFCVGYRVVHADGRSGFCKALDYSAVFASFPSGVDPAIALQIMTQSYNFERDLLGKCEEYRMSRIIRSLDSGAISVPGALIPVSYIIFEFAEYDVRRELDQGGDLEAAMRLRTLHHIATGLKQLHAIQVAHQDLKPSNVLIVDPRQHSRSCKLGDLGRASDSQVSAPHDNLPIAGDCTYAPPEQLYNATPVEFGPRRLACDLYHLGSLATYMFTSMPMNALLSQHLHPTHHWTGWTGEYSEVLPYVRDAFGSSLTILHNACPTSIADRLTQLVSYLCEPDPSLRGHPVERRKSNGSIYDLQRIVSEFDLLAARAAIRTKGVQG